MNANEVKTQSNWPYAIDEQGKRILDMTEYINNRKKGGVKPAQIASSTAPVTQVVTTESKPALQPNESFDTDDRKTKALGLLKKVKSLSTVKGLIDKQKEFKGTDAGKDFISGATIDDVVKLNAIEVVGDFYKFVK